jgi:hypothetical protein
VCDASVPGGQLQAVAAWETWSFGERVDKSWCAGGLATADDTELLAISQAISRSSLNSRPKESCTYSRIRCGPLQGSWTHPYTQSRHRRSMHCGTSGLGWTVPQTPAYSCTMSLKTWNWTHTPWCTSLPHPLGWRQGATQNARWPLREQRPLSPCCVTGRL